ncbi:MAG: hypothetical protein ACRBFS_05005 [Aureispira sp.]
MIRYWFWILIGWNTNVGQAQDLSCAVRHINPALYLNNMDNRPVYNQNIIHNNSLLFTRFYPQTNNERKEQSYHYCFLNERHQNWILEVRLDQHDFRVSEGKMAQALRASDFGFRIYHLEEEKWIEVTKEVLPCDFLVKFQAQFPDLQISTWDYYYYNQNPLWITHPHFERKKLHFKQNGKKVLCLAWRKKRFVWK